MIPKDFTIQENNTAICLSELGIRYERQYPLSLFKCDFFLPELNMVVECDGVYGHFKKSDRKRDKELIRLGVLKIVHVREKVIRDIKEYLLEELCRE